MAMTILIRTSLRVMMGMALGMTLLAAPGFIAASAHKAHAQTRNAPVDLTRIPSRSDANAAPPPSTLRRSNRNAAPAPAATASPVAADTAAATRLATIGVEIAASDAPDRLASVMWQGASMENILALYDYLPPRIGSSVLDDRLAHVMLAFALPPAGGARDIASLVQRRIAWLAARERGRDFATLLRGLPMDEPWLEWHRWLVMHDLITRNDKEACGKAATPGLFETVEAHKITAFCHIAADRRDEAAFALDVLAGLGVEAEDPVYFMLMRKLLDGGDFTLPETGEITPLHLVLMDSAQIPIPLAALAGAQAWRDSLGSLRYLAPDAATHLAAISYDAPGFNARAIATLWAGLPQSDVSADEALLRLAAETPIPDNNIALARLQAWQAASRVRGAAASDIATRALAIDFGYGGARGLDLWLPMITANPRMEALRGFAPGVDRTLMTGVVRGWAEILAIVDGGFIPRDGFNPQYIMDAEAFDALPMLTAFGIEAELPNDRAFLLASRPPLAGNASLPLGRLAVLEDAVATLGQGDGRGEVLMLAALTLGDTPPENLDRDAAARLVAALMRAGLEQTARELAREILTGWVLGRALIPEIAEDAAAPGGERANGPANRRQ